MQPRRRPQLIRSPHRSHCTWSFCARYRMRSKSNCLFFFFFQSAFTLVSRATRFTAGRQVTSWPLTFQHQDRIGNCDPPVPGRSAGAVGGGGSLIVAAVIDFLTASGMSRAQTVPEHFHIEINGKKREIRSNRDMTGERTPKTPPRNRPRQVYRYQMTSPGHIGCYCVGDTDGRIERYRGKVQHIWAFNG